MACVQLATGVVMATATAAKYPFAEALQLQAALQTLRLERWHGAASGWCGASLESHGRQAGWFGRT
jgi:hypothetical protein